MFILQTTTIHQRVGWGGGVNKGPIRYKETSKRHNAIYTETCTSLQRVVQCTLPVDNITVCLSFALADQNRLNPGYRIYLHS